jgi:predicted Zn-dependent protease
MDNLALKKLEENLIQLTSNTHSRRYFLQALPFLLTACATAPKTRYREGSNKGQKAALTVPQEEKMTREYLPKMNKEYPAVKDKWMQDYVSNLGHKIVNRNNLKGKPYQYNFTVVQTKAINAFALPAGTIYVTAPLIAATNNEAELAGVIGHEIGHVQARHTAERIYKAKQEESKSWMYSLGGVLAGGGLGYALGKALCPPKDKQCIEQAAKYGAMAGAAGGLLIQKFAFMANSREDEMEADRIGFRTAVAAGYSKNHVGGFFETLLQLEKKSKKKKQDGIMKGFYDALSTHPPSDERVKQMRKMASRDKSNGIQSTRDYFAAKKRVKRFLI